MPKTTDAIKIIQQAIAEQQQNYEKISKIAARGRQRSLETGGDPIILCNEVMSYPAIRYLVLEPLQVQTVRLN